MSGATRDDVYRLIGFIEGDLRGVNAKFTELRSMLAAGAMEHVSGNEFTCLCGAGFHAARALALHVQNVHDGPAVPMSEAEAVAQ